MVSVVTRETSDDCNSSAVAGNAVYLQVARLGGAFLFYASPDGRSWRLVRAFALPSRQELRVGFGSQSPIGPGLRAVFSEIRYESRKIRDVFTGQ